MKRIKFAAIAAMIGIIALFGAGLYMDLAGDSLEEGSKETTTARVVAHGDLLYHDVLYLSAQQEDGTYDFAPYFQYVRDWIGDADLAIGDYEGTISDEYPLGGYPLFNAPVETATIMQELGYDVVDLAHNHILDSGLDGAIGTAELFRSLGIDSVGVYAENRATEEILVKEVNGIKIAILGYSYGYNGNEANLTDEELLAHMSNLDEGLIEEEIKHAEEIADVTIVMPQMGEEYRLEPTDEQVALYHKMIDWGADVIFGGHPHVPEPSETIEKDGQKKFIIYSMGNFLSNQTYERLENEWTERGLLMDVTFEKTGDETIIKTVQAHPSMIWVWANGGYDLNGYPLYNYRIMMLEDFIEGGRYREEIDPTMQEKVDRAYQETNELVNLQW